MPRIFVDSHRDCPAIVEQCKVFQPCCEAALVKAFAEIVPEARKRCLMQLSERGTNTAAGRLTLQSGIVKPFPHRQLQCSAFARPNNLHGNLILG